MQFDGFTTFPVNNGSPHLWNMNKENGSNLNEKTNHKTLIYFVLKDNFTTRENCNTSDFWKMIAQSAINHPSKIAFDHTLASRQIPIHISKGPTKYLKDRLVFWKTLSQNYVCRTYGVQLQTVEPHTIWKSAFIQDI